MALLNQNLLLVRHGIMNSVTNHGPSHTKLRLVLQHKRCYNPCPSHQDLVMVWQQEQCNKPGPSHPKPTFSTATLIALFILKAAKAHIDMHI